MHWFGYRKKQKNAARDKFAKKVQHEVEANHRQSDKVVKKAQDATDRLNGLIQKNGFTVQIYNATGGKK